MNKYICICVVSSMFVFGCAGNQSVSHPNVPVDQHYDELVSETNQSTHYLSTTGEDGFVCAVHHSNDWKVITSEEVKADAHKVMSELGDAVNSATDLLKKGATKAEEIYYEITDDDTKKK